jgi:hypothetical protein
MFEKFTITTILEAAEPIAHHSGTKGNIAIAMDERMFQLDGRLERVPIITGDAMRHAMRHAAAMAFLDAAGLLDQEPMLSEAAVRLLFAGGIIKGASGASVSLAEYAAMVDLMPALGLLGGCAGNRMMPGRLQVGRAVAVCKGSSRVLDHSPWAQGWISERIDRLGYVVSTSAALVDSVQRVLMDPTMNPTSRAMLSAGGEAKTEARLLASESASESGDDLAAEDAKSSMMPRTFEVVRAGTLFTWDITATLFSDLDRDTFSLMYAATLADLVVGGKRGVGHGRLVGLASSKMVLSKPASPETLQPAVHSNVGEMFRAHVHERRARIVDFLAKVVA